MATKAHLLCMFVWVPAIIAGIVWEKPSVELYIEGQEFPSESIFKFQNEGSSSVYVEKVESDCGCMSPVLAKHEYRPGERGEVKVKLVPKFVAGQYQQSLKVWADDQEEPHRLVVKIKKADAVEILGEKVIEWGPETWGESKKTRLRATVGTELRLKTVPNCGLCARLVPSTEANEYDLEIASQGNIITAVVPVFVQAYRRGVFVFQASILNRIKQ